MPIHKLMVLQEANKRSQSGAPFFYYYVQSGAIAWGENIIKSLVVDTKWHLRVS